MNDKNLRKKKYLTIEEHTFFYKKLKSCRGRSCKIPGRMRANRAKYFKMYAIAYNR